METDSQRVRRDSQTSHCSAISCCWMNYGTCSGSAWKSWRSLMTSMPYWVSRNLVKMHFCMLHVMLIGVWLNFFLFFLQYIFLCLPSSPAGCGGLLPSPCHGARKQTSYEGHPGEPAFSYQGWASTAVAGTTHTCHTLIPGPVLFQGTI